MENGLRVIAVPRGTVPQVAMRILFPAGSAADPLDRPGTAAMVGSLLTEGTRHHTAEALNARLDLLGAAVSVHTGHDFAGVEVLLLSETLADALPLIGELIMHPVFPERELERVRAETLDALKARRDEPANVADDRTARGVFGEAHPYGRLTGGTPAGVETITRSDLAEFHGTWYRPAGAVLVAAGDFDTQQLRGLLDAAFAGWKGDAILIPYPSPPPTPVSAERRISVPWKDAAQAEIRVAGIGLERRSPDWVTASVANYILGGSTITGRLGANLREDKGWTYGARSAFAATVQPGGWVADTAVDIGVVEAALEEILREIRRMGEEAVGEEELQRAKNALILSLPRAFETPGHVVSRFATIEAFSLADEYWLSFPDRVRSVTAEDVLRISRTLWDPGRLVRVVVGSEAEPHLS